MEVNSKLLSSLQKNPILSKFCKELTSITQDQVESAEKFNIVVQSFIKWLGEDTIVSWGDYDRNMLQKQYSSYFQGAKWCFNHVNLKAVWAKLHKRCKQCGMKKALEIEGIPLDGTHHRGIDDARNILKIYKKIKGRINSSELLKNDIELLNLKLKGHKVQPYEK